MTHFIVRLRWKSSPVGGSTFVALAQIWNRAKWSGEGY